MFARAPFWLRLELVSDAVAGLDEGVSGGVEIDLLPQLAHEDVDGTVAPIQPPAPDLLKQLVPRQHAALLERQCVEQAELRRSQLHALAVDVGLDAPRVDSKLFDFDPVASLRLLRADAAADCNAHAHDQLLHRERLHEVVVGPDLEGVDAILLAAAGADDDDRRSDAFAAGSLDQLPAVEERQHQ